MQASTSLPFLVWTQAILDQGNHAAAIFAKLKLFFFSRSTVRSAFLLKKKRKSI
jgi:hypothetical protein